MMRIDIFTLFPEMFRGPLHESILKRAMERKFVEINIHNIRDFTHDKHRQVDDYPYGGGPGMILKPEPIFEGVESIEPGFVILLTPQGERFNHGIAKRLSCEKHLIFICGHYEGVDERVRIGLADLELSIGDYILTGGELPCMVVVDAVVRLLPGVLGNISSVSTDSFYNSILDYPQYTRPAEFRGMRVPDVLLSGNHEAIKEWRKKMALERTRERRPDLLREGG